MWNRIKMHITSSNIDLTTDFGKRGRYVIRDRGLANMTAVNCIFLDIVIIRAFFVRPPTCIGANSIRVTLKLHRGLKSHFVEKINK